MMAEPTPLVEERTMYAQHLSRWSECSMAILSVQAPDFWTQPDGTRIPVTPSDGLSVTGPRMEVTVSLASSVAEQVVSQGQALPSPVSDWALIDTGASSTCIDEGAAKQLRLPVIDVVTTSTPSDPAMQRNVYPINIQVAGMRLYVDASRVIGVELATQGLLLPIRRDFLSKGILIFNGYAGQWSFSI